MPHPPSHTQRSRQQQLPLLAAALLVLCTTAACAAADSQQPDAEQQGVQARGEDLRPLNPYSEQNQSGCEDGFCIAEDPSVEEAFYQAAASGDVAQLRLLLQSPQLNTSRNIVPDAQGFARVLDVAMWAAVKEGQVETVKVLLEERPEVWNSYEEGHVVDMAVSQGSMDMLLLLLDNKFTVGSYAMAYAAKYGNTEAMKLLMAGSKKIDLKAAMTAACSAGNETVTRLLIEAGGFTEMRHPVSGKAATHDFRGDFVAAAASTGHSVVLEVLFDSGYAITWSNAQDLVKAAAGSGSVESVRLLFNQEVIADDKEELEEAVENALKVAAQKGHTQLLAWLLETYPTQAADPCPAALLRASRYGHWDAASRLRAACNISASSRKLAAKLQDAAWQGHVFGAAQGGHTDALRLLLAHDNAGQLLASLHASSAPRGKKEKQQTKPKMPGPGDDPLVAAAAGGYSECVALLSKFPGLCAPCAAVAAAKAGHADIVLELAQGPAASLLKDDEDLVHDAMRVVAELLDRGAWEPVEKLLRQHESDMLAPYLLPAIAHHGRVDDMAAMLALIERLGCRQQEYVNEQLFSAMVTAALNGFHEVVTQLTHSSLRRTAV